jgi:hypothetical protein
VSLSVDIQVTGSAKKLLSKIDAKLINREELHHDIAVRAENTVRDYLIILAGSRHATADRLGATPSGHLERAAESVHSESDANAATVNVTSPGMSRAFGDITIKPGSGKKYLTIPATAEAYNTRAGAFNDLRLAFFKGGLLALVKADQSRLSDRKASGFGVESKAAKADKTKERPPVYYWLKKEVKQKQDRTLLPSDKLLQSAAEEGTRDWLKSFFGSDGY